MAIKKFRAKKKRCRPVQVPCDIATKRDLKELGDRLLKALGERVDPKAVKELSIASAALEKAVASNQPKPKLSGQ